MIRILSPFPPAALIDSPATFSTEKPSRTISFLRRLRHKANSSAKSNRENRAAFVALIAALLSQPHAAYAALTVVPNLPAPLQNLGLTTFADGFPNSGSVGPLGIAFTNGGGVLVADKLGNVRLFPNDNDGQHAADAPVGQNYGGNNAVDLARLGSTIYMTRQSIGDVVQLNSDGTFNQVIITGLPAATGMLADPLNGHLFVTTLSNNAIFEIDPIAKTKSTFLNVSADGLSLSNDGMTIYTANSNGHVVGYSVATKAQLFDSGFIPGGIDGTAVGAGPVFGNLLFVNTNSGTVLAVSLDPAAPGQTTIATGGSRGDFVRVDLSNDTLLLTQTDGIIRLEGAKFSTPEPSTFVLVSGQTLGVFALGRRRFRRPLAEGSTLLQ